MIYGAAVLVMILFFQPETLRSLVGNGAQKYANPTPVSPSILCVLEGTTDNRIHVFIRPSGSEDASKSNKAKKSCRRQVESNTCVCQMCFNHCCFC